MFQLQRLFGITRVPKPNVDVIVGSHPSPSTHIILLIKDQIFVVDVYSSDRKRLTVHAIQQQFQTCVDAVEQGGRGSMQPPIGILGGQGRDDWARDHIHLEQLDRRNVDSFGWIETALFAVSLDDRLVPLPISALAQNVFHGFDGHNRWSDKSLNVVVTNDGRLGVHGEHSPCDALVPAQLVDFAVQREPAIDPPQAVSTNITPVRRLEWVIDDTITRSLCQAQTYIHELIADSDVHVLHYTGYGSEFIKRCGKVSPDAFTQMCLQVAFYRLEGYTCSVYETASTRKYLHGRTETCRSHTIQQKQFVETFESKTATMEEKYKAFEVACRTHVSLLQTTSNGMGCDRHLLGLRLCLRNNEGHEIFTNSVFGQSSKWQLSTSALFAGERLMGTGFGTVVG
jgi:hypothetical protein